jgi:hypothetical protein
VGDTFAVPSAEKIESFLQELVAALQKRVTQYLPDGNTRRVPLVRSHHLVDHTLQNAAGVPLAVLVFAENETSETCTIRINPYAIFEAAQSPELRETGDDVEDAVAYTVILLQETLETDPERQFPPFFV